MRSFLVLLLALGACAGGPAGEDDDFDGKGDRDGLPGFDEVDASHSTKTFRKYVGEALQYLAEDGTDIGRLTYESIRDGRVLIDELADLTCLDYERLAKDLNAGGATLELDDFGYLRDRGSEALAEITDAIYGFQWQNRVYVARGLTTVQLASTLVHEVNHVLNRSEVGYYDDLPVSAFRHEYRGFFAEYTFRPKRWEGVDLVEYVIDNYQLDRDGLPAEVLANPLTPELLPTKAAWQRRGGDGGPEDQSACKAH
jgi:hypothetical protein